MIGDTEKSCCNITAKVTGAINDSVPAEDCHIVAELAGTELQRGDGTD